MKRVMVVFGTRPEAIKMCPLVKELKKDENVEVAVCVSGHIISILHIRRNLTDRRLD